MWYMCIFFVEEGTFGEIKHETIYMCDFNNYKYSLNMFILLF